MNNNLKHMRGRQIPTRILEISQTRNSDKLTKVTDKIWYEVNSILTSL